MDKGWQDIGYHLYVEADGTLNMGRPLSNPGAHCRGENSRSFGIAYCGGLNAQGNPTFTMTVTQAKCIRAIISHLQEITGKHIPLYGHREFKPTFCPGFDVHDDQTWPDV